MEKARLETPSILHVLLPSGTGRHLPSALIEDILTEADDMSAIDQDWEFGVLVSLSVNDSSGIG